MEYRWKAYSLLMFFYQNVIFFLFIHVTKNLMDQSKKQFLSALIISKNIWCFNFSGNYWKCWMELLDRMESLHFDLWWFWTSSAKKKLHTRNFQHRKSRCYLCRKQFWAWWNMWKQSTMSRSSLSWWLSIQQRVCTSLIISKVHHNFFFNLW